MDVLQRAKMLRECADPKATKETFEKWEKILEGEPIEESYGELEQISNETDGRRFEIEVSGEQRTYWVASDAAWINGKGITIDAAYRVFSEDDNAMEAKQVQNGSEINAIKGAYMDQVRKILGKDKPGDE